MYALCSVAIHTHYYHSRHCAIPSDQVMTFRKKQMLPSYHPHSSCTYKHLLFPRSLSFIPRQSIAHPLLPQKSRNSNTAKALHHLIVQTKLSIPPSQPVGRERIELSSTASLACSFREKEGNETRSAASTSYKAICSQLRLVNH